VINRPGNTHLQPGPAGVMVESRRQIDEPALDERHESR
jgi:hypothetical protein